MGEIPSQRLLIDEQSYRSQIRRKCTPQCPKNPNAYSQDLFHERNENCESPPSHPKNHLQKSRTIGKSGLEEAASLAPGLALLSGRKD